MSTSSLSSVAQTVVDQYSQVGKLIVGAYRTGAQRLVTGANTRYVSFLNSRDLPLVTDAVKASLIDVQTRLTGMVETGIATGTQRAEQAIDLLAGGVSGGIVRATQTVERVESAFSTDAISTVGQLSLPVAQISLAIANSAVEGTKRLSARVAGVEDEVAEVVAATEQTVKRAARKTVRGVKAKARA
jgi:hypothetical protein